MHGVASGYSVIGLRGVPLGMVLVRSEFRGFVSIRFRRMAWCVSVSG